MFSLDWFWERISKPFDCKHRGRIGPSEKDDKQIRILNRIITWTNDGIGYEGDQRHVEIAMKDYGITTDSKGVSTPGTKEEVDKMLLDEGGLLLAHVATECRALAARLNYLALGRLDIQYATKEVSRNLGPSRRPRMQQQKGTP